MFDVAVFRHLPDEAITSHTPAWLLDQYERVDRASWRQTLDAITATEAGALRALARAFGKDAHLNDLPTYEQVMAQNHRPEAKDRKPAWMDKFEEVNRDRKIQ